MSVSMVRVFVNASGVDVPAGSTALDAVRLWSVEAAREIGLDKRLITDSRGLPIDPATPVTGGFIMRLIARRDRSAAALADADGEEASDDGDGSEPPE